MYRKNIRKVIFRLDILVLNRAKHFYFEFEGISQDVYLCGSANCAYLSLYSFIWLYVYTYTCVYEYVLYTVYKYMLVCVQNEWRVGRVRSKSGAYPWLCAVSAYCAAFIHNSICSYVGRDKYTYIYKFRNFVAVYSSF